MPTTACHRDDLLCLQKQIGAGLAVQISVIIVGVAYYYVRKCELEVTLADYTAKYGMALSAITNILSNGPTIIAPSLISAVAGVLSAPPCSCPRQHATVVYIPFPVYMHYSSTNRQSVQKGSRCLTYMSSFAELKLNSLSHMYRSKNISWPSLSSIATTSTTRL